MKLILQLSIMRLTKFVWLIFCSFVKISKKKKKTRLIQRKSYKLYTRKNYIFFNAICNENEDHLWYNFLKYFKIQ